MSTADPPSAVNARTTRSISSASPGASTAVGSSRSSTRVSVASAFTISSRCLSPTESDSATRIGLERQPDALAQRSDPRTKRRGGHRPPGRQRDILRDRQSGDRREVLVHHPDTEAARGAGEVMDTADPFTRTSPLSGRARP